MAYLALVGVDEDGITKTNVVNDISATELSWTGYVNLRFTKIQ